MLKFPPEQPPELIIPPDFAGNNRLPFLSRKGSTARREPSPRMNYFRNFCLGEERPGMSGAPGAPFVIPPRSPASCLSSQHPASPPPPRHSPSLGFPGLNFQIQ